jgi:hypothetical protein
MIDPKVVESRGLNEKRLKAIFTAKPPEGSSRKPFKSRFARKDGLGAEAGGDTISEVYQLPEKPGDYDLRQLFEQRIRNRLNEGMQRNLESFNKYAAVDLALDTPIVSGAQLPLMMLAQGYIDVERCSSLVGSLSEEWRERIFEKDPSNSKVLKVNIPRFWEISHNLVKSLTTRRTAAIATPIAQRVPLMKYDSRATSLTGRLKGDLMTQYAEIMSDGFGYRHDIVQTVRDVSTYTHQVEFVRSKWSRDSQLLSVPKPKDATTGVGDTSLDYETKEVITREGLEFVAPHPSRVYWDRAYPIAKINSDNGPVYLGYWDMIRVGDLRINKDLWNTDEIEFDAAIFDFLAGQGSYFELYYRDRIAIPKNSGGGGISLNNDRLTNTTYYAQGSDDVTTTIAYHFEKINPKTFGLADYDHDVWLRLTVAGNTTVVHAEVLACSPACVYHYDENDSRDFSPSFAMMVMPYQDQISNLLSQLLETQFQGLMKLYTLNVDGMKPEDVKAVEDSIGNKNYYAAKNVIIKYSAEKMKDLGIDPRSLYADRLKAIEVSTSEKTGELIRSIVQVLSLAERLLFFSPQELGQVAPREISATEANIVNNTTLGIRDYHGLGIEEGLDAKKRMIYESAIAFGSDEIELPVLDTYSPETIQAAGFEITGVDQEGDPEVAKRGKFTVSGDIRNLVHNYIYSSRDGTEREPASAVANSAVQLLDVVAKYPAFAQSLTLEDGTNLLNTVGRALGMAVKFRLPEGVDPKAPMAPGAGEEMQNAVQQLSQAVQQIAQQQQQNSADVQAIAKAVGDLAGAIQQTRPTARGTVSPSIPQGAPPLGPQQYPQDVALSPPMQ